MRKGKRRSYSKEFKQEAVRLVAESRRSYAEVAESLETKPENVRRWCEDARVQGPDAFRGQGNRTVLEEENRQLRLENRRLKQEQEILKKAAYFAKHLQ